jgi:hypothetical protein
MATHLLIETVAAAMNSSYAVVSFSHSGWRLGASCGGVAQASFVQLIEGNKYYERRRVCREHSKGWNPR